MWRGRGISRFRPIYAPQNRGCCCLATQSCPALCDPVDCSPPGSPSMDSPGKNPGVGCHFLLQGFFLTQGSNPGLLQVSCIETDSQYRELTVTSAEREVGGARQAQGNKRHTPRSVKEISYYNIAYSRVKYSLYLVIPLNRVHSIKILNHYVVHPKQTQECKSTVLQLKNTADGQLQTQKIISKKSQQNKTVFFKNKDSIKKLILMRF